MTKISDSEATLAEFLRAARARLSPEELGFSRGRRRTPGLRREEVATLSGISTTWYTWIEQGRTKAVSAQVLARLSATLQLSQAERHYLFRLAHQLADNPIPDWSDEQKQGWQSVVDVINAPAYILDRHWDMVAWNQGCTGLFPGWLGKWQSHNLLRFIFFSPQARETIVNWPERAKRVVAEYRADSIDWQRDPVHQALVDELCSGSETFANAWREQVVLEREGGERVFQLDGNMRRFIQLTLRMAEQPGVKLVMLRPTD